MRTLNEIVSAALSSADSSIKIASESDATPENDGVDDFDSILGLSDSNDAGEAEEEVEAEETETNDKTSSYDEVLADATYAMKLASGLDAASGIVSRKLAMDATKAPGPQVFQAEHQVASTHPTPTTTSVPGPQKSHGGGSTERTNGQPNGIETNKADFSSPDWTKNKEAALALIQTKTAQAEQFMYSGEVDMATQLLDEVEALQDKFAADPSSPQASLPSGSGAPKLDTEPGPASHVPDNAGMANLTRAGAKDSSTREATKFFSEKPKKDNAVAAHVGKTDGLKVSSLLEAVEKRASSPGTVEQEETSEEGGEASEEAEEPKEAQLKGERLEAARAYLQKQAAKATDPDATEAEKAAAAEIIDTVEARLGKEQTAQLLA